MHFSYQEGWGEPTCTLGPWKQGFRHPTRNECMSWFTQIYQEGLFLLLRPTIDPIVTSRKHCEKEPQLFSRCGYFDHLDMQSLNLFVCNLKNFGAFTIPLERF